MDLEEAMRLLMESQGFTAEKARMELESITPGGPNEYLEYFTGPDDDTDIFYLRVWWSVDRQQFEAGDNYFAYYPSRSD